MFDELKIIGREKTLFNEDILSSREFLESEIGNSSFLILGAAGSIGRSVVREIISRSPKLMHVVDISENNLVELVRDLRSSDLEIKGEFKTFCLDISSKEYDAFIKHGPSYDYVLNFSAMKHVRSEKDPYSLMRMIEVNILNTKKTLEQSIEQGAKKYFCVSTDKAASPVNMMGGSKLIMEHFLSLYSPSIPISTARFANVAFSDGSLLYGFEKRMQKKQPLVAPKDVLRYFVSHKEAGELCLLSALEGNPGEIYFPKLYPETDLVSFTELAERYLQSNGFRPRLYETEAEAKAACQTIIPKFEWPCLFSESDTTGEKSFEEFFAEGEVVDFERYSGIGVIASLSEADREKLDNFVSSIEHMRESGEIEKQRIVELFFSIIPNFNYTDKGKYLDEKM